MLEFEALPEPSTNLDIKSTVKCDMDKLLSNIFNISDTDVIAVSQYSQRTSEWFNARKNRLTASNFGAALDKNPYCSSDQLLVQLLYKSFSGNKATEYGTTNEPVACRQYINEIEALCKKDNIDASEAPCKKDNIDGTDTFCNKANINEALPETTILGQAPTVEEPQRQCLMEPQLQCLCEKQRQCLEEPHGVIVPSQYTACPDSLSIPDQSLITYTESGLTVSKKYPFLAASPDGIITANHSVCPVCTGYDCGFDNNDATRHQIDVKLNCEFDSKYDLIDSTFDPLTGKISQTNMWQCNEKIPHKFLLEIKCPFRQRLYGKIPTYYYCQIVGAMHIMDLPYTHFYVWTPKKSSLECFPRNDNLWNDVMLPGLLSFYFDRYVPLIFLQWKNLLDNSDPQGPNTNWLIPKNDVDCEYVRTVYRISKSYKNLFAARQSTSD
jgi:hypothetical protein